MICLFIHVLTPTHELISSRSVTFVPSALQGIFSEIDLEGDAESELQQTEWLQNKKTGKKKYKIYINIFKRKVALVNL